MYEVTKADHELLVAAAIAHPEACIEGEECCHIAVSAMEPEIALIVQREVAAAVINVVSKTVQ